MWIGLILSQYRGRDISPQHQQHEFDLSCNLCGTALRRSKSRHGSSSGGDTTVRRRRWGTAPVDRSGTRTQRGVCRISSTCWTICNLEGRVVSRSHAIQTRSDRCRGARREGARKWPACLATAWRSDASKPGGALSGRDSPVLTPPPAAATRFGTMTGTAGCSSALWRVFAILQRAAHRGAPGGGSPVDRALPARAGDLGAFTWFTCPRTRSLFRRQRVPTPATAFVRVDALARPRHCR
jgi:hypothetical protein